MGPRIARKGPKKNRIWVELGRKGGQVRAQRLSAKERRRIAMLGVRARLAKQKKQRRADLGILGELGRVRLGKKRRR